MIPPRGEVNAADAFDIGSFDEEDTKGIKVHKGVLEGGEIFYSVKLNDCLSIGLLVECHSPLNT